MKIITKEQARRFILLKQGLIGSYRYIGKQGAYDFIREAGCIQYDPVDVCGKNAELTLQSRSNDRGVEPGFSIPREFPKLFLGACLGALAASPGMLSSGLAGPVKSWRSFLVGWQTKRHQIIPALVLASPEKGLQGPPDRANRLNSQGKAA